MIRKVICALAGLGALALSGCIASGSKMDLAPHSVRPASAPFPNGDYCMLDGDKPPFKVKSSEQCLTFTWNAGARRYQVSGVDDDGTRINFEIVTAPLKGDLMIFQLESKTVRYTPPKTDKDDDTPPFMQSVGVVRGEAGALIAWDATADEMDKLVARHPALTMEGKGTERVIAAGPRAEALKYLADFADLSLKGKNLKGVGIYVHDKAGVADHALSPTQGRDVEAALAVLKPLAKP